MRKFSAKLLFTLALILLTICFTACGSDSEPRPETAVSKEPTIVEVTLNPTPTPAATPEPAPTPEPTPDPVLESEPPQVEEVEYCYITPTGKKYHDNDNCNNGSYTKTELKTAISKGLTPCKKCYG